MNKNIAFFDFDGTISKQDSLFLFLKFLVGKKRFYMGMLLHIHVLVGYFLHILTNHRAKEKLSVYFFGGYKQEDFLQKSKNFLPVLKTTLKNSALQRLQWHKDRGDAIAIVSASFEAYLKPLCREFHIECIGTTLEVCEGKLSGRFTSPNCYGIQKVKRIQNNYTLSNYEKIYVYGDSAGDKEMLELATIGCKFYQFFYS